MEERTYASLAEVEAAFRPEFDHLAARFRKFSGAKRRAEYFNHYMDLCGQKACASKRFIDEERRLFVQQIEKERRQRLKGYARMAGHCFVEMNGEMVRMPVSEAQHRGLAMISGADDLLRAFIAQDAQVASLQYQLDKSREHCAKKVSKITRLEKKIEKIDGERKHHMNTKTELYAQMRDMERERDAALAEAEKALKTRFLRKRDAMAFDETPSRKAIKPTELRRPVEIGDGVALIPPGSNETFEAVQAREASEDRLEAERQASNERVAQAMREAAQKAEAEPMESYIRKHTEAARRRRAEEAVGVLTSAGVKDELDKDGDGDE